MFARKVIPAAVLAAAAAAAPRTADAQALVGKWFSPTVGGLSPRVDYDQRSSCAQEVGGQSRRTAVSRHAARVLVPLWQNDDLEWSIQPRLKAVDIGPCPRLPDTGERLPNHLWDVGVATMVRRRLANGWIVGAGLSVGSPSDRPFASDEEVAVDAAAFVRIPAGQQNAWLVMLSYANGREFCRHVPLPGAAYHHSFGRSAWLLAGVPLSMVQIGPLGGAGEAEGWFRLNASYLLVRTVHVKATFRVHPRMSLYAAFDWDSERLYRHDRRDHDDRLLYYEKRLAAGARVDITDRVYMDASAGWAFDRFWFEGEGYDDRGDNRIDVDDGPFVGVKLGVRF
jgi:hypothetical protein